MVEFFKCWKYPSNSSETFKILFCHQNNQFEAKTACFADFSILTKIGVSGPYCVAILLVDFFGWVFQMLKIPLEFFWNIQNFVLSSKQSVWSKNSMFCGLFNFDQNRCIRTLPAWQFCWLIFLVEFFKCWKYPSNSSETFKILFFHQNNQFEAKTACFADFSILTKIAVSGLTGVWGKNSMFCGRFNFDQNRCIRTLPAWPFFSWFFGLIFWNVESTLRILLKHSKLCSFIKTISLKQKQHVLLTFQLRPKSLYPDLTGVAIFCGLIFLVEFFKCWKYPSNSSETFKILFFHQNNQFEAKTACFADFSILTKIAVSGSYRRGHFFGWFFEMLKITFEFFWNIQNFVLSSKQSVWGKNSMFCGRFNFDQNRCIRTLPAWPFFSWFFGLSFSNVESTLRILLKHSKLCSFIKTISLKQKQHVLLTFQLRPKSLYPDLTGVAIFCGLIFFVEFFKCWKYPSNSSETFKILFFHQNNQFEAKTACFADFSILTKIAVSVPYRRGHFVSWFFWLIFLVEFFKCWK